MKTIFVFLVLLAGFVTSATLMNAAIPRDLADQKFAIIQTCEPNVWPSVGETLPASGVVRMVITVDADGKLSDWLLIESTHERFAKSAVAAVKRWSFKPAVVHGEPIGIRTELVFNFDVSGQVVSLSPLDTLQVLIDRMMDGQSVKYVCRGGELDVVPKPIVTVSPLPVHLDPGTKQQGVLVDFYIDETGRPRMATVESSGNIAMAQSAVAALEQWRFTVPQYKGRAVAVRASQWFEFGNTGVAAR